MELSKGTHFYVDVLNIGEILRDEAKKDDDLKRTIHRLHTYFCGLTKLIKQFDGSVEKYAGARGHVVFTSDVEFSTVLKALCACFVYTNDIFNSLGKYSQYTKFRVSAGVDFGDYYSHTIDLSDDDKEETTIGSVANCSAKEQAVAAKNTVYVTERFLGELSKDEQQRFSELTAEEYEPLKGRINDMKIYKADYEALVDEDTFDSLLGELDEVEEKVKEEANSLNLAEMTFEGVQSKLDFARLSRATNKKFEGATLCADLRGFTRLFALDDSNLAELAEIMADVFRRMQSATDEECGTRVQFQGDRIVAVFNDYGAEESCYLRAIRAGMRVNQSISDLDKEESVREVLGDNHLAVGIGCSYAYTVASRLGLRKNRDNIILGDAFTNADKAEDRYASSGEIVIHKALKEQLAADTRAESTAFLDSLSAISTTGFYKTTLTIDEYEELVSKRKNQEATRRLAFEILNEKHLRGVNGETVTTKLRPWRP